MLSVVCPVDGTVHQADPAHAGKMLRCAKCGRQVLIGKSGVSAAAEIYASSPIKPLTPTGPLPLPFGLRANRWGWTYKQTALALCCLLLVVSGAVVLVLARRSAVPEDPFKEAASSPNMIPAVHSPSDPVHSLQGAQADRKLPTGTLIRRDGESHGSGVLSIDNSGGADAEVKIVYQAGRRTVHDVFVGQGDRWECRDLDAGLYTVLFSTGADWDASTQRFTRDASYFVFGKSLWYGKQKNYSTSYEITLYDRPDGTVERQWIDEKAFNGN